MTSNNGQSPPPPGKLRLYDNYLPLLDAGDYTVSVSQQVKNIEGPTLSQTFEAQQALTVSAPRFVLDPADVAAVHPPDQSRGQLEQELPHIVLNQRSLPWERALHEGDRKTPWIALLLFSEDEIEPPAGGSGAALGNPTRAATSAVSALLRPGPGILGPDITLNPFEEGSMLCRTIDVSTEVFTEVTPRFEPGDPPAVDELRFLAHCRQINTAGKVILGQKAEGWFSVVVSNRFPGAGPVAQRYIAHLVSLEGFASYLVDAPTWPAGVKKVRLVSLARWSFTSLPEQGASFRALMEGLVAGQSPGGDGLLLRLPTPPAPPASPQAPAESTTEQTARETLALGYVPLPWRSRVGEQTFAWHRGPLAPQPVRPFAGIAPFTNAAAAMIYNRATGLFDLSYAVAWQTGRLLALSCRSFAAELLQWRRQGAREVGLDRARPVAELRAQEGVRRRAAEAAEPPEIVAWLARLALLEGVPFVNLVPDARLLPAESIRFFYVDPNYVEALIDGALSVGVQSSRDTALNELTRDALHSAVKRRIPRLRQELRGSAPAVSENDPSGSEGNAPKAGCLLRSATVSGWPGLEVQGYAESNGESPSEPLELLRMDRLASDVMLCLFSGVPAWVEVREPQESLAFGVERGRSGQLVELRNVTGPDLGEVLGETVNLAGFLRSAASQVLAVEQLGPALNKALSKKLGTQVTLGPADFALQMIHAPEQMIFQNHP